MWRRLSHKTLSPRKIIWTQYDITQRLMLNSPGDKQIRPLCPLERIAADKMVAGRNFFKSRPPVAAFFRRYRVCTRIVRMNCLVFSENFDEALANGASFDNSDQFAHVCRRRSDV